MSKIKDNHFAEFCRFIRSQKWMSKEFGDELTQKFTAAQADAFERGAKQKRVTIENPIQAPDAPEDLLAWDKSLDKGFAALAKVKLPKRK